jgi:8-oxo-dGTP pyrophosphatase MutT (NUDIX family)
MSEVSPAQRAATLILLRDGAGAPELFMQARAKTMGFAAGMMVFPGGKVDAADVALAGNAALTHGCDMLEPDDAVARVAAIRESFEEAGVLLAAGASLAEEIVAAARPLVAGRALGFGDFLESHGLSLDLDVLTPFARGVPPDDLGHGRRYDTRFYLARMPGGIRADHDGCEATHSCWVTAAEALARADAGESQVIFPTRRNLERIAQFASIDALLCHARETPIGIVQPQLKMLDGKPFLCIPEGAGYPVTTELLTSAVRG